MYQTARPLTRVYMVQKNISAPAGRSLSLVPSKLPNTPNIQNPLSGTLPGAPSFSFLPDTAGDSRVSNGAPIIGKASWMWRCYTTQIIVTALCVAALAVAARVAGASFHTSVWASRGFVASVSEMEGTTGRSYDVELITYAISIALLSLLGEMYRLAVSIFSDDFAGNVVDNGVNGPHYLCFALLFLLYVPCYLCMAGCAELAALVGFGCLASIREVLAYLLAVDTVHRSRRGTGPVWSDHSTLHVALWGAAIGTPILAVVAICTALAGTISLNRPLAWGTPWFVQAPPLFFVASYILYVATDTAGIRGLLARWELRELWMEINVALLRNVPLVLFVSGVVAAH